MDQNAVSYDSQRPQSTVGLIICLFLLVTSSSVRLYAQRGIGQLWALDNILIVIATIPTLAIIATCLLGLHFGLGLHISRVIAEDSDPPSNVVRITLIAYIVAILNVPAVNCIKFSILAFYRRVFTSHRARQRIFTYALWFIGTYTVLLGLASSVVIIIQCEPIHYYWDPWPELYALAGKPGHPVTTGWCLPTIPAYGVPLMAGLLSDFIILALPAVGLWNLQMRWMQKIGVFASLSFGVFACVIEVVRIYLLFTLGSSQDVTWTYTDSLIWTAVELSVAVTCASIPAMAPLLKRAQRGPGVRGPSRSYWGLLTSQVSGLKAKMKHIWRRNSQKDSESLAEFVLD